MSQNQFLHNRTFSALVLLVSYNLNYYQAVYRKMKLI